MRFEALEQTLRLRLVSGPVDKKFFFISRNSLSHTVCTFKFSTVALIESASRNKSICLQTLKVGANDRSAQELQNAVYNEVHTKFLKKLWAFVNGDIPI
jgi:hypothetical protein